MYNLREDQRSSLYISFKDIMTPFLYVFLEWN